MSIAVASLVDDALAGGLRDQFKLFVETPKRVAVTKGCTEVIPQAGVFVIKV